MNDEEDILYDEVIKVLDEERKENMAEKYAGADWVEAVKIKGQPIVMSELGRRVADLLGELFHGIYHIRDSVHKTDWSNDLWIEVPIGDTNWATCDGNNLTRLVFLCHDTGIRCEIEGRAKGWLTLVFHQRETREGNIMSRHPTLETAYDNYKRAHPHVKTLEMKLEEEKERRDAYDRNFRVGG